MKIGSISAIGNTAPVGSVSAAQRPVTKVDTDSKRIEDDIDAVEQQKQALSPKEDISVDEKMRRRQELQQELSSLKTKLRMSEAEAKKESQKAAEETQPAAVEEESGESRAAEALKEDAAEKEEIRKENIQKEETQALRSADAAAEDKETKAVAEKQDTEEAKAEEVNAGTDGVKIEERAEETGAAKEDKVGFSEREMRSMIAEDEAAERAKQQGIIVARIENDIVILKGEIKQDEDRGTDVTQKKEELKEQEERAQRAVNAQFSAIGQTNQRLQEAAQKQLEETRGENVLTARRNAAEQPLIRATNYSLGTV